ncbi:hypothetical protein C9374_000672 [Naegleria lovaniensis]|uniref:Uncharacterized protein n=1 Tax=Naegleria lovaniensis TaxID=51637 RepID=A0AA88KNG0_NAELO|nr:uncharacterized protein C9374_000672 [Naegleria lovaniensis]KAG2388508.1 hypothetical protein C9374_000672 [Naegleria lovaniensis]
MLRVEAMQMLSSRTSNSSGLHPSSNEINTNLLHVHLEPRRKKSITTTKDDDDCSVGSDDGTYYSGSSPSFSPTNLSCSSPSSPSSSSLTTSWVQEMCEACKMGDEFLLHELIDEREEARSKVSESEFKKNYNINELDKSSKRSALHWAMSGNHVNVVIILLSLFTSSSSDTMLDVNVRDGRNGATPMHLAVANESLDCIKLFVNTSYVRSKLEQSAKDCYGNTFFHVAFRLKKWQVMETLIQLFGNDIINSRKSNSETCLHVAAKNADVKGIKWLLSHGAKIHLKDENGRRPLASAVFFYREDCHVEGMVDSSNSTKKSTMSGYNYADLSVKPFKIGESITTQKSEKLSVPLKPMNGKFPNSRLHPERQHGNYDTLFTQEEVNRLQRTLMYTLLLNEEVYTLSGGSSKKWLKSESDQASDGTSLFHLACLNGNKEFISAFALMFDKAHLQFLLEKRDSKTKYNSLHFACEGGHFEVLELLTTLLKDMLPNVEQFKQYINAKDQQLETPVHKAARKLASLIEENSNTMTSDTQRAIHCVTHLMYSHGADMNVKNLQGEKPIDILDQCGFFTSGLFLYMKK